MSDDTETLAEVRLTDDERLTLRKSRMTAYEDGKGGWLFRDATEAEQNAAVERILAARIVQARAGEGALREVRRAVDELLRTLNDGRYRFEEIHVRADLNHLRALTDTAGDPT